MENSVHPSFFLAFASFSKTGTTGYFSPEHRVKKRSPLIEIPSQELVKANRLNTLFY